MTNFSLTQDEFLSELNQLDQFLKDFIEWEILFYLEDSEEDQDEELYSNFTSLKRFMESGKKGDIWGTKEALKYLENNNDFKEYVGDSLPLVSDHNIETFLSEFAEGILKDLNK